MSSRDQRVQWSSRITSGDLAVGTRPTPIGVQQCSCKERIGLHIALKENHNNPFPSVNNNLSVHNIIFGSGGSLVAVC